MKTTREILIAWEQYKKSNWYESKTVDVEKKLIDEFIKILSHPQPRQSAEEIAQWVIDNRYAKNENNKISDFEMYNILLKNIVEYAQQDIELPSDEEKLSLLYDEIENDYGHALTASYKVTEGTDLWRQYHMTALIDLQWMKRIKQLLNG